MYQVQGLGEEAEPQGTGEFFLGEDGALYQVQGFGAAVRLGPEGSREGLGEGTSPELGRYFLGGRRNAL